MTDFVTAFDRTFGIRVSQSVTQMTDGAVRMSLNQENSTWHMLPDVVSRPAFKQALKGVGRDFLLGELGWRAVSRYHQNVMSFPQSLRLISGFVELFVWSCLVGPDLARAQSANGRRPNIIYILADDLGYGDLSCLNSQSAWKTPNLDRLAEQGMVFSDAHSASGVCTPSRYALLTGRYAWRGRLKENVLYGYDRALLEPERLTVAGLLQSHGYATAMMGKWHLGLDWARTGEKLEEIDYGKPFAGGPQAHGFEEFFGISASLDMPPYVWLEGAQVVHRPSGQTAASPLPRMWRAGPISSDFRHEEVQGRLLEKTLGYLNRRAQASDGRPFFLYLALASPHTPIVPTAGFVGRTGTTPYGDFVVEIDAAVGELMAALAAHNLAKETLLIFTADNGCSPAANLEELRTLKHDPSAGYRGHKADLYEGGHRVPFLARWPGQIPAGSRCGQAVGQVDLLATCADLLGVRLPASAGEDGVSMLPLLRGALSAVSGREALVHHSINGSFAIRQGSWKLLLCPDSGGWSAPRPGSKEAAGLPPFQLFNLAADPGERTNLAAAHPDLVQRLGRLMRSYVELGRSTPGVPQPVVGESWSQTFWRTAFPP